MIGVGGSIIFALTQAQAVDLAARQKGVVQIGDGGVPVQGMDGMNLK